MNDTRARRAEDARRTHPAPGLATDPRPPSTVADTGLEARLAARIIELETEQRRIFDDAQRQADVMFAQYQLSQLLAGVDTLPELARVVLAELVRTTDAEAAALWLRSDTDATLRLTASLRRSAVPADASWTPPPSLLDDADAGSVEAWARTSGWAGVALDAPDPDPADDHGPYGRPGAAGAPTRQGRTERAPVLGWVAVRAGSDGRLASGAERFLGRVRHELGMAFRTAKLRAALERERAALGAILDGAGDAIVAVDAERRVVRSNRAALALLEGSDVTGAQVEAAIGARCREFLGCGGSEDEPDAAARCGARCPFAEVLEDGEPIGREQILRGSLGDVPVGASYARMSDPGLGAVAVMRDLRPSRAQDEFRTNFVTSISHDLRTPLAIVSGYVQTLLHLELDEATRRHYLERAATTVNRLSDLVGEIVRIAELESDAFVLSRRPTDVAELVDSLAPELADEIGMPRLDADLEPELPVVDVDPARIQRALSNLVANAAKYGVGPSGSVRLRARRDEGVVVVTIEDDGPGIEPADRERIFERFYRGRAARASAVPGSGLGLYLARRLVEAHGTWIRLEDREHGTAISLALPIAKVPRLAPTIRRTDSSRHERAPPVRPNPHRRGSAGVRGACRAVVAPARLGPGLRGERHDGARRPSSMPRPMPMRSTSSCSTSVSRPRTAGRC